MHTLYSADPREGAPGREGLSWSEYSKPSALLILGLLTLPIRSSLWDKKCGTPGSHLLLLLKTS